MPYNRTTNSTASKSTLYTFNGLQSFSVTGSGICAVNPLRVESEKDYYFSCGIKVTNGTFNFLINSVDTYGNLFTSSNLTGSSFYRVDSVVTIPSGRDIIDLKVSGTGAGSISYFDNMIFMKSLFTNGSFETTSGWSTSNCTLTNDSSNERSGTNCGKITATANNGYIYQDVTTISGQWYTVKFHGKATAGDSFKFVVRDYDSGTLTDTSYVEMVCTIKATSTSTRAYAYALSSGDIIYVDDFSFIPLIEESPSVETSTPTADSYNYGKWGINAYGSIKVDGSDTFCAPILSGTDLNAQQGSLGVWYNPYHDYNTFLEDSYLFYMEDFLKVYYDTSTYKFIGEIYNGTEFISSGCQSETQVFTSGTWIHVGFTYDNTIGLKMVINGDLEGQFLGGWSSQEIPSLCSIGCISGTLINRANGDLDDIIFFARSISIEDMRNRYNERHPNE